MAKKKDEPKKAQVKKISKPKKKKKVISKTEKKLRNQRRYQVTKRNKIHKQKTEAINFLNTLKPEKIAKTEVYEIPDSIKKQLGIKRKKYRATKQTIINAYFQKIYKINNIIDEKETKLIKRFKFKQKENKIIKRKKGEIRFNIGFVWNVDENAPLVIFGNPSIKTLNGFSTEKQANDILNLVENEKLNMSSEHFMYLVGKDEEDFKLLIENLEGSYKRKSARKNFTNEKN